MKFIGKFSWNKLFYLFVILLFLWSFVHAQNQCLVVSDYVYESEEVGADLDGYKILQISDLHNASFGWENARLVKQVKACEADCIVLTGDLVDSNHTDLKVALSLVEELVTIAPVYYITGNHEYWLEEEERQVLLEGLWKLGVTDLDDSQVEITKGKDSFTLMGLDDQSLMGDKLRQLVEDSDDFSILLAHEPQYMEHYAENQVDLVLSGHAHGGQFRLPFIGGIVAPDQGFFPKYTAGVYVREETEMIVSRGLGNSVIPIRLWNEPELVCVELRRSAE